MLKLIVGTKGSGKTKTMIDMIDKAVKTTSGNIVVIEKCMKLTTEINHSARLVDVDEYGVAGADMLYGFVAGVLAGNYDITELFLDGILRITDHDMAAAAKVLNAIDKITSNIEVVVTVSADAAELPEDLKKRIFGQDEAVDAVVSAIRLSRAGFDKSDRPVGSFLFTGPTGVGKTELAKQLAESLGVSLIRFDMSEYSEPHTVSRLIGAPPGYVGFSQGGQLTEQVTAHPYCVLLLDEIEKAHPDILNVLLQVMDNGTLTDNSGRKADFRNVILIMTSNAGARMISRNVIGFGEAKSEGDDTAEIKKYFSPEFRNRLDAIIRFKPLAHALILKITDKFLKNVAESLRKRNVEPVFTSTLRNYLAEHGFDPQMGARPMRRLIQDIVERPLAEAVLFGPLKNGGKVTVGFNRGKVQLKFPGSEAQGPKKQEALPA